MRNKAYIKKIRKNPPKLIIEIPLTQKRSSPFDEDLEWEGENIIGIIEPRGYDPRYGFAYRIDMSYKDKADQWTDLFYEWHDSIEDFKEFCEKNKIEIFEYAQCAYCKSAIYNCFTRGEKGNMCSDCEDKGKK